MSRFLMELLRSPYIERLAEPVSEVVTYYSVFLVGTTSPVGIARRKILGDEGIEDEMLRQNLVWERDSLITEWKRGDATEELVEISEREAEELIERFRERWGKGT
jgi:hypothetical protein